MRAQQASTDARALAGCDARVWDTQHVAPRKVFDFYRRAVCEVYMDWSLEFERDDEFQARIETIKVGAAQSLATAAPRIRQRERRRISPIPRSNTIICR